MFLSSLRIVGLVGVVLGAVASDVHAGLITTIGASHLPGGVSTGTIGPLGVTPAPNNDEAPGANPNGIGFSIFVNAPGVMEVEFLVAASGGVTEYVFTQSLLNNSGGPWSGMRFELGFGTGDGFVRAGADAGIAFDLPGTPTSSPFALQQYEPTLMEWGGAIAPWISPTQFVFSLDVGDGLVQPGSANRFTLRQVATTPDDPAVPEPSTLALAAVALLWGGRRLRRP